MLLGENAEGKSLGRAIILMALAAVVVAFASAWLQRWLVGRPILGVTLGASIAAAFVVGRIAMTTGRGQ
jgi:hypothetical protein